MQSWFRRGRRTVFSFVAISSALACSSSSAPTNLADALRCVAPSGSGGLRPFSPPNPSTVGSGQLLLTASGEALAQQGYAFPADPADGVFADGWAVHFQHFIATFDSIRLSSNPDEVPTDQSQTGGTVAQLCGPWAVDLSTPTANDVMGKEQGETAIPIAILANQNLNGGKPFATDGTKYAAGFSVVTANPNAINVNLDADALALYRTMVDAGCSVLYAGTASFEADPTQCTTQDPEFSRFPPVVDFSLCFKSPTDYVNCDNQDIQGTPFGAEPHPRGVLFTTNAFVTGEITLHTDHPFWESVVHDTPAHFDQFAARVALAAGDGDAGPDAEALSDSGVDGAAGPESGAGDAGAPSPASPPTVTMNDLVGVDYLAFTDRFGNPVQWRSCVKDSSGAQYGKAGGPMSFDPENVPKAPVLSAVPVSSGLRDYYDFSTYNQSTQGHWNGSDGLCFVSRQYPSPP